jgi:hypothetical protein
MNEFFKPEFVVIHKIYFVVFVGAYMFVRLLTFRA